MSFTSTGELYDYEITYDHNTEEFVKGKGYANIHQYLGGFAFKNMLAGYSGYQIGNSIGSAIGGTEVDLVNQLGEKIKRISYSSRHSKDARWIPKNLKERLAMEEVLSNPYSGKHLDKIIMNDKSNGWLKETGWIKMSKNVEGVEIHYVYNTKLNVFDDFKFK